MKIARYLGLGVMAAAPSLMRLAFSFTDDPSVRLLMVPVFLAISGCGLTLMMSASDRGSLASDVVTLGLSGAASSESTPRAGASLNAPGGPASSR